MKKLTHGAPKPKRDTKSIQKRAENPTKETDAKCCAKTSKNAVGCHD